MLQQCYCIALFKDTHKLIKRANTCHDLNATMFLCKMYKLCKNHNNNISQNNLSMHFIIHIFMHIHDALSDKY